MALLAITGAVIQPVTEVCKYVLVPIKQQASYLICYKKYVDNFKREAEKLELKRNDIQGRVEGARRNSEEPLGEVTGWLSSVEDIIADVQRLDNQLKGNIRCFDLHIRYKLGKEAKKKIDTVTALQRDGKFSIVSYPSQNTSIESLPDGDFSKYESTESAMIQVMDALKDKNTNIIGVYGMGGVGKTTLMKQVAKLVKKEKLYEEVVLVTLPQNPDLRRIQSDIAEPLGLKMPLDEGNESMRACKLSKRLRQGKNVLVILDNLWGRLELADVGIPHGEEFKGCYIIFTTRSTEVCDVMESQVRIAVNILSEQDSWSLFREKAGGIVDTPALHDLAWEVAKECGGLPLAIVTLGRALRNKKERVWKNALLELQRSNPASIKDMNAKVFAPLEMSYTYLESEEAKSFFLLCSLFPQGNYILIENLIKYGMGEGLFCEVEVNTLEEASVRVHTLIDRLKSSCLLLEGEGDDGVRMHDVVHDVATSIASRHGHGFFVKVCRGLKEWPKIENLEKCKRISLAENNLETLPDSIICPQLSTLNLELNDSLRRIPERFFMGMKALRVLDLCTTNISSLPSSIKCLENIRTLWLDRCRELKDVAAIGELKTLEILCLKESGVDKLPKEIGELTNLKLLDLSKTKLEIVPPNVISRLTRLEELYMGHSFNQWEPEGAEDARQASIAEFEFLKHLCVLDVYIKTLSCMPQSNTSGPWKNLMKFQICIGGDYMMYIDHNTQRCIKVEDISFPIPYSVQLLFDITNKLRFVCCRGLTNLADRQELRGECLEALTIDKCCEMECVISMEEKAPPLKFKSLKSLHLFRLENLKTICNGPLAAGCLENLRLLDVFFCNNLLINILPSYLVKALQKLEKLVVIDCRELQEVFNSEGLVDEHAVLTNLRRLHLKNLPSLSIIWKGAIPIGSLRNLETLIVEDCGLRYIFSPTFPQFAARLADLRIKDCEKMENLIMEENFPSQSPAIGCFQNLKFLVIHKCHGFKSLLSSSSARELTCLKYLEVHSCDGMEVIIRKGEEVADKGVLPRLETLALSCLPKLTNFYEQARILNFDSLEYVGLWSCAELKWVPLGPQSAPNLKWVDSSEWTELEKLEWNDESVKSRLQNWFEECPSIDAVRTDPFEEIY